MSSSPSNIESDAKSASSPNPPVVAQDELSAWTAVAMDAIESNIAILDDNGVILYVNRAWKRFADENNLGLPDAGVGANYLTLCEKIATRSAEVAAVATAIKTICAGTQKTFTHEYACVANGKSLWYQMRILRISGPSKAAVVVIHENITTGKLHESNYRKSEESLEQRVEERTKELRRGDSVRQHIIDFLPGGVIHIASDGQMMDANAGGLKFLGLSSDALITKKIPDFTGSTFHEDGSPCPPADYPASRCLATGQKQKPVTIGLRRADRTIAWAVFTAVPVPCPINPEKNATVVTFLDITERKQADEILRQSKKELQQAHEKLEQRVAERTAELNTANENLRHQIAETTRTHALLRESEERFRQIADNISEIVYIADVATRKILYINPAFETIFGLSCESMYQSGTAFLDCIVPEDRQAQINGFSRRFIEPYDAIYRITDGRGKLRWIRSRSTPVRNENGDIFRITGVTEDITDIKLAEEEVLRLASIVESSDDAIIGKSLDGVVTSWNFGAQCLFGYSSSEIIGKHCSVLSLPEDEKNIAPLLKRVINGEHIDTLESRRVKKDKSIAYVSLTISAVRDSNGKIIGVSEIERDITEKKRLEEEVLLVSERERRQFGQDLHDGLGQHLTGIGLLTKSLQNRLAAKALSSLPVTENEANELAMVTQLVQDAIGQARDMARGLHPVEPVDTGLMDALSELADRVSLFSRIGCTFKCGEPVLVKDNLIASHLYRIAQEAVTNSVKHAGADAIQIQLSYQAGTIHLMVRDNGTGLKPEAELANGLGLRIMKFRAGSIGGEFSMHNEVPKGMTVSCKGPCLRG